MRILFSILIILLIFIGFKIFDDTNKEPTLHTIVNEIFNDTARIIEKKHMIHPSGQGGSMLGGIVSEIMLAFDTNRNLSREDLRRLLIESTHELVQQVNANPNIQKYLVKTPFTEENVQIIIYNHDKTGREVYDPDIATAQIFESTLTYSVFDSRKHLLRKHELSETYEEALNALQNQ